jgi:hypothetical protein
MKSMMSVPWPVQRNSVWRSKTNLERRPANYVLQSSLAGCRGVPHHMVPGSVNTVSSSRRHISAAWCLVSKVKAVKRLNERECSAETSFSYWHLFQLCSGTRIMPQLARRLQRASEPSQLPPQKSDARDMTPYILVAKSVMRLH